MDEKILESLDTKKLFIHYTIPAIISMVINGSQTMIGGMVLGHVAGGRLLLLLT